MSYPCCYSINKIKHGFLRGRQRYLCKDCGFNFLLESKSKAKSLKTKRLALDMYLEGLVFAR